MQKQAGNGDILQKGMLSLKHSGLLFVIQLNCQGQRNSQTQTRRGQWLLGRDLGRTGRSGVCASARQHTCPRRSSWVFLTCNQFTIQAQTTKCHFPSSPAKLIFPAGNENQCTVPAQNREASRQLGHVARGKLSTERSCGKEMNRRQNQVGRQLKVPEDAA